MKTHKTIVTFYKYKFASTLYLNRNILVYHSVPIPIYLPIN